MLASSRDLGWTSLLVDHDRIIRLSAEFETRATTDQTIVVLMRGAQELEVRKGLGWQVARYQAGTVGLTTAGQTNTLRRRSVASGTKTEKAVLYLPVAFLTEAADHYRLAGQRSRRGTLDSLAFNDAAIAGVALGLVKAVRIGAPDFYAEAAARWLATHLLAAHAGWDAIATDTRRPGVITERRLQRVLALMLSDLSRPLHLTDLAAEAGVSKFHFTRLFRQQTGWTPCAYLLDQRLSAAGHHLATREVSIKAVAAGCGFPRATHFAVAFARKFGMSPSAYRRSHSS